MEEVWNANNRWGINGSVLPLNQQRVEVIRAMNEGEEKAGGGSRQEERGEGRER
jgi:hypothetical protein